MVIGAVSSSAEMNIRAVMTRAEVLFSSEEANAKVYIFAVAPSREVAVAVNEVLCVGAVFICKVTENDIWLAYGL